MKISVVMPVYNERWTIRESVRRVMASPHIHELVIVDDGSDDGTEKRLPRLVAESGNSSIAIKLIRLEKNEGKGSAVRRGVREAEGDAVIVQDADLEYHPEDYPQLLRPILEGRADAVFGSRFSSGAHNVLLFWHTVANRILTFLCNFVSDRNFTDVWTGYKVFRAGIIRKLPLSSRGFGFEPEVAIKLAQLGCRIYEVPISYHGRSKAEGKKIGFQDALIALWTIFKTAVAGDLGELAIGEQTLRIMSKAGRYNLFLYGIYSRFLGSRVIEIGSGVGNISRFLLDRDSLVLTDNNPAYLEALRQTYRNWDYVEVNGLDIERPGPEFAALRGTFDTAVCFNVIEHIQDDSAALSNIAALLKPEGHAIFIVPAHQWLFGTLDSSLEHYRRYDRASLGALLRRRGFEVLESRYLNPVAVPGWFLNGRLFSRKIIPGLQLSLCDGLTPLIERLSSWNLPFGLSLFAVARKTNAA